MRTTLFALAIASVALAGAAEAHVTVDPATAPPGSVKLVFRVPHGCQGSATVSLRITIPEGVIGVKGQPKPGWSLATETGPYAKAYPYFHGRTVESGVKTVTWSGGMLPGDQFDEFAVIGFVTDAFPPGTAIPFTVDQACEQGSISWSEIAGPGVDAHDLAAPAPIVTVAEPAHGHGHH